MKELIYSTKLDNVKVVVKGEYQCSDSKIVTNSHYFLNERVRIMRERKEVKHVLHSI